MSNDFKTVVVGFLEVNCYLIPSEAEKCVYIIDPGANPAKVAEAARDFGYDDYRILLTHGHIDHVSGVRELMEIIPVNKFYLHADEMLLYNSPGNSLLPLMPAIKNPPQPGNEIESCEFSIIHTPGHTRGGVCFYFNNIPALFSGDTLFRRSIGRTDFPTGDMDSLLESINEKLFVLPEDLTVYPGHGPDTTIGEEKSRNSFLVEARR